MNPLKQRLAQKKLLVADGAWGTELSRRGLAAGEVPESWNLTHPDVLRAMAADYVAAGADVVLTNSFGGSSVKLAKAGLADKAPELNRLAAQLSKEAADDEALVFASIGPTGEFLAPLGTLSEDDALAAFAEQVKAFVEGRADGVVIESMSDLAEAKVALRAVRENSEFEVVVSMTFEKGARGYATIFGVTPEQAVRELEAAGADVVGANCGAGMDNIIEVAKLMRPATTLPLWFKPNAGLPELVDGETVFRETPDDFAARLPALLDAGAQIVGGCCGSTPDHIRLLVAGCCGTTPDHIKKLRDQADELT